MLRYVTPVAPPSTGGGGGTTAVVSETPSGTVNGTNTVFTTGHTFITGSTAVYHNGIREARGSGYTETLPNTITFSTAPLSADVIIVDYQM